MTVRVIKKKPSKLVVKRKVCEHCGATLEYTPNDVHRYEGTDISGGPDGREWINCPECNKEVTIRSW
jgi:hypothetical protein